MTTDLTATSPANRLRGIVPPLLTPMTSTGELDLDSLRTLTRAHLDAGVHGLFVLGSSGQVAYLTDAERDQVTRTVVDEVSGRVPVLVGTPDLTARRMVEQARRAADAGADAIVVTAPLYALNDEAEIEQHFRMVSAGAGLPVHAYDVPVRVGRKLSVGLLTRLAADGVIAGIKDSSGDDVAFRRLVRAIVQTQAPVSVLTGHEVMVDGMLLLGADGAVPGLANVDPAGYVRLFEAAELGDWVAARSEQDRICQLFEIAFVPQARSGDAGGIGAFKQAAAQLGLIAEATMPAPLAGLSAADAEQIAQICASVGLVAQS